MYISGKVILATFSNMERMDLMKLKNFLIVVSDMEVSKKFYKEIFGLGVVADFGENVILYEGLVLQEKNLWETFIERKGFFRWK